MATKISRRSASFIFSTALVLTSLLLNPGCITSPEPVHVSPPQEAVSVAPKAQGIINKNCLVKCPAGTRINNILVDHDAITLSSNRETKFADWVAYLSKVEYIDGPERGRKWAKDPDIDDKDTFKPVDYKGMSQDPYFFDRGHQAPLASFKNHPKWQVVNYMSNITPQKKDLNQGSWVRLESAERKLVVKHGEAYVLTGPYYDQANIVDGPPIKRINYKVPSGYWKIIAIRKGDDIQVVSFSFSQATPRRDEYCKHLTPMSNIEKLTGFKFFDGRPVSEDAMLMKDIGCEPSEYIKNLASRTANSDIKPLGESQVNIK